jgi:hypothetical protein
MNKRGSALLAVIIIILVLIIITVVWFHLQQSPMGSSTPAQSSNNSSSIDSSSSVSSASPIVSAVPIVWETYENDDWNFSIQYPGNWSVISAATSSEGGIVGFGLSFGIPNNKKSEDLNDFAGGLEIYPVTASETIPEVYKQISTIDLTTLATTSIELAGTSTVEYLSIPGEVNYNEAFIFHNGKLYGVYQLPTSIDSNAIFRKFAASLTFTN